MALGDTQRVTSEATLGDGEDEMAGRRRMGVAKFGDGRDEEKESGGAALAGEKERTWGGEGRENMGREWEERNN